MARKEESQEALIDVELPEAKELNDAVREYRKKRKAFSTAGERMQEAKDTVLAVLHKSGRDEVTTDSFTVRLEKREKLSIVDRQEADEDGADE